METGDVISWYAGKMLCKGIVKQEFTNTVKVVCFEINNVGTKKQIEVQKSLIAHDKI